MNTLFARIGPATSIRDKLHRLVWRTTATALAVVATVMVVFQVWSFSDTMIDRLAVVAQVMATNVTAALEFEEPRQATKLLESIKAEKDIAAVAVFTGKGTLFAGYGDTTGASESAALDSSWLRQVMRADRAAYRFRPDKIEYLAPVALHSETVGFVYLHASPERFYRQLAGSVALILGVTLVSGGLAFYWAGRLQRRLVEPIFRLADSMRKVTEEQNFGIRVATTSQDEVGQLTRGFNEMLAQLEQRDHHLAERSRDLADLNRHLETAVEEANQAKARAEEATRSKSVFLATMSHEIRTPMNGILGMTELLRGTPLSSQQRRFADAAYQSGEHLLTIINDILDFSKIEAGKLEIETIDFSLRQLVEDVGYMFARAAEAKGLEMVCAVPHDLPMELKGDPVRVRQILTNLVGNAVKFTSHGEIVVRVKLLHESAQQARFRFEVQDTGIGIDEAAQSRMFSAFSQADTSTTRRYGGSGLGLAIAKRLVEMMQGRIGLESTPGRGSVFWFEIPFVKQDAHARTLIDTAERLKGLRVLVVDDNATNREILEHQLIGWSMQYTGVESGAAALHELGHAAARGDTFDLVILDFHMPEMDGLELAQAIKADRRFAAMPLVMLSSLTASAGDLDSRAAQIDYYLTKPVRQSDLYDAIATAMSLRRIAASDSPAHAVAGGPEQLVGRVLVAEDNPVNREVAAAMLESLGVAYGMADNGLAALEQVSRESFDLVLMDCQMPEMDGFEATGEIRRRQREGRLRRTLPVVALTANAVEGDRERCIAAGMDDYLSKPFTRDRLAAVLARWLPAQGPGPTSLTAVAQLPAKRAEEARRAPSESAEAPINPRALEAIRSLTGPKGPSFVASVIRAYLADAPGRMQQIRSAVTAGDAERLRKAAHGMKSSSANVGAETLADACKTLEALGRGGTTEGAESLLAGAEKELERVLAALQAQLAESPQPALS